MINIPPGLYALTNSFVVEFVGILSSKVQREERKIVVSCFSTRRGSLREFFFHFVAMQWRQRIALKSRRHVHSCVRAQGL